MSYSLRRGVRTPSTAAWANAAADIKQRIESHRKQVMTPSTKQQAHSNGGRHAQTERQPRQHLVGNDNIEIAQPNFDDNNSPVVTKRIQRRRIIDDDDDDDCAASTHNAGDENAIPNIQTLRRHISAPLPSPSPSPSLSPPPFSPGSRDNDDDVDDLADRISKAHINKQSRKPKTKKKKERAPVSDSEDATEELSIPTTRPVLPLMTAKALSEELEPPSDNASESRKKHAKEWNALVRLAKEYEKQCNLIHALSHYIRAYQLINKPTLAERIEKIHTKLRQRTQLINENLTPINTQFSQINDPCLNANNEETDEQHMQNIDGVVVHTSVPSLQPYIVPSVTYSALHPYQRDCLHWLCDLHSQGHGGLLADDMGLGKTVQLCSLFNTLFHSNIIRNILLVMPRALFQQWQIELNKWITIKNINIRIYEGRHRSKEYNYIQKNNGILLCTYDIIRTSTELRCSEWDYIICDEGHKIKNPYSQISHFIRLIPSFIRIVVTGTPILNDLNELWSLFDFITQGKLLGFRNIFQEIYSEPIEKGQERNANIQLIKNSQILSNKLNNLIKPYFLRRTKKIINHLMNNIIKNDCVIWIKCSASQLSLYQMFISSEYMQSFLNTTRSPLTALAVLKKICDHPRLVHSRYGVVAQTIRQMIGGQKEEEEETADDPTTTMVDDEAVVDDYRSIKRNITEEIANIDNATLLAESSKLSVLLQLLTLHANTGHRTLVFSHYKMTLDIIQRILPYKYIRLDGETQNRQVIINEWNENTSIVCFLLTIGVGGVGLNLVGADRVIIFDPSWTPAADDQAADRAYRMGQTRDVIVYRFITCGTVEEVIYRKQAWKKGLVQTVRGQTGAESSASIDEENNDEKSRLAVQFTKAELREVFTLKDSTISETAEILRQCKTQMKELNNNNNNNNNELFENHLTELHSFDAVYTVTDHDMLLTKVADDNAQTNGLEVKAETVVSSNDRKSMSDNIQAPLLHPRRRQERVRIEIDDDCDHRSSDAGEKATAEAEIIDLTENIEANPIQTSFNHSILSHNQINSESFEPSSQQQERIITNVLREDDILRDDSDRSNNDSITSARAVEEVNNDDCEYDDGEQHDSEAAMNHSIESSRLPSPIKDSPTSDSFISSPANNPESFMLDKEQNENNNTKSLRQENILQGDLDEYQEHVNTLTEPHTYGSVHGDDEEKHEDEESIIDRTEDVKLIRDHLKRDSFIRSLRSPAEDVSEAFLLTHEQDDEKSHTSSMTEENILQKDFDIREDSAVTPIEVNNDESLEDDACALESGILNSLQLTFEDDEDDAEKPHIATTSAMALTYVDSDGDNDESAYVSCDEYESSTPQQHSTHNIRQQTSNLQQNTNKPATPAASSLSNNSHVDTRASSCPRHNAGRCSFSTSPAMRIASSHSSPLSSPPYQSCDGLTQLDRLSGGQSSISPRSSPPSPSSPLSMPVRASVHDVSGSQSPILNPSSESPILSSPTMSAIRSVQQECCDEHRFTVFDGITYRVNRCRCFVTADEWEQYHSYCESAIAELNGNQEAEGESRQDADNDQSFECNGDSIARSLWKFHAALTICSDDGEMHATVQTLVQQLKQMLAAIDGINIDQVNS